MGRSRGGLITKVRALTDARGQPIKLALTPGQAHDADGAAMLLTDLADGGVVLCDKAYDADWIRERIESQGTAPNVPDKANRKQRHCFSRVHYKERNQIERFFDRIKHFRHVAMRFEKLAANYLAIIKLASIRVWLRIPKTRHGLLRPWSAFRARAARIGSDAEQPGLAILRISIESLFTATSQPMPI